MVMEGVQEDMGDGSNIQCVDHPFKSNTPGGICAFCLQEKLGKLVSSSFPIAVFPSSSSSTSPSFRSAVATVPVQNLSADTRNVYTNNNQCQFHHQTSTTTTTTIINNNHQYNSKRSRLAFLLVQKKKKNKDLNNPPASDHRNIIFKRSKSTATPRRDVHFSGAVEDYGSHKRTFWPFLYLTKHSSIRKSDRKEISMAIGGALSNPRSREKKQEFPAVEELNESPKSNQASFDRKVSRSRSVGCGSRSFSGDFFERISTGFGDCTLRRVESQREGKPKSGTGGRQDGIKERVKCGGLFSGFMITSSSSSSSSSSNWISSSTEDNVAGKVPPAVVAGQVSHGRSRSWGWAFASPIRAFSRPSGKRGVTNKNTTPNLAAIPSLLAVRS